ncbi:MAG: hypothetical protein KDC87_09230 [Planctomycetes bacterium]|nr:hypothetical protein [Planctomycetota bacterium]
MTPDSAPEFPDDAERWQEWWAHNEERWLDLRTRVRSAQASPEGRTTTHERAADAVFLSQHVIPALIASLADDQPEAVRREALLALAEIGAPSAAPLVDLLGGTVCAELRDRAAAVLAQLGEVAAPPLLRGLVASADPIATGALLECVARLGARAVPDLFDFLASGAPPADKCVCLRAAARLARGDAAGRASLRRGARVLRGLCADAFLRPWAEGVLQCVAAAECAVSPHRSLDLPSRAAVVADAR